MIKRLCKSADSMNAGECPAVYTTDDPDWLIAQGKILGAATTALLQDRADDEAAVRIPTETVVHAVALLLIQLGRPDMAAAVEQVTSAVAAGAT